MTVLVLGSGELGAIAGRIQSIVLCVPCTASTVRGFVHLCVDALYLLMVLCPSKQVSSAILPTHQTRW